MVVIEIDLPQQTVATRIHSHAIIHRGTLQSKYRRRALRPDPVPGIAVPIQPECVGSGAGPKSVRTECDRRLGPHSPRISPSGKGVAWIKYGFANFGVSDVSTGFRRVHRFFPSSHLTGRRIVPSDAVQQNVSADHRHDADGANNAE